MPYLYGITLARSPESGHHRADSDRNDNELRQTAADFTQPPVRTTVRELSTTEGRILIFRVGPSDYVQESQSGDCYQRIGDESRRLSFAPRQELEWDRGFASFDGTRAPEADISDLDSDHLRDFQELLGSSSSERALHTRELLPKDGHISVAAYVLFARRPQTIFPSAHVRVLKYLQNERGAGRTHAVASGSDVRCEGSLPSQISEAADAIAQMIPHRHALGDSGRFESLPIIPGDAWLESLVNAVVHRSYSISGDHVRVEISPIESTSQARAGSPAWPTLSRPNRSAAMRAIRALPESAQISESQELGEGIRRIFAEMRRTGLSEPMYVQSSQSVRLTLLTRSSLPSSIEEALGPTGMKIFKAMRQAQRPLGTGQIAELVEMTRPTVLRHLTRMPDAEIVTWRGEQPKDPHATWRLN